MFQSYAVLTKKEFLYCSDLARKEVMDGEFNKTNHFIIHLLFLTHAFANKNIIGINWMYNKPTTINKTFLNFNQIHFKIRHGVDLANTTVYGILWKYNVCQFKSHHNVFAKLNLQKCNVESYNEITLRYYLFVAKVYNYKVIGFVWGCIFWGLVRLTRHSNLSSAQNLFAPTKYISIHIQ